MRVAYEQNQYCNDNLIDNINDDLAPMGRTAEVPIEVK